LKTPEEIASVVAFVASTQAVAINGAAVRAEGGCSPQHLLTNPVERRKRPARNIFATIMAESEGRFMAEQNFSESRESFPAFHFFVIPVLTINFGSCFVRMGKSVFSLGGFLQVLVAVACLWDFSAHA